MENCIDSFVVMALYLKSHPGSIVCDSSNGHGCTYFKYDFDAGYFIYCNPQNKKRNGWYRARGLDCFLRSYMSRSDGNA